MILNTSKIASLWVVMDCQYKFYTIIETSLVGHLQVREIIKSKRRYRFVSVRNTDTCTWENQGRDLQLWFVFIWADEHRICLNIFKYMSNAFMKTLWCWPESRELNKIVTKKPVDTTLVKFIHTFVIWFAYMNFINIESLETAL